jgi:hypothetical protein
MSRTGLCLYESPAGDFAAVRKIEVLGKIGLALLTRFSYEFMSLDLSNLTTMLLGLVCRACVAALARQCSNRKTRGPCAVAFD